MMISNIDPSMLHHKVNIKHRNEQQQQDNLLMDMSGLKLLIT